MFQQPSPILRLWVAICSVVLCIAHCGRADDFRPAALDDVTFPAIEVRQLFAGPDNVVAGLTLNPTALFLFDNGRFNVLRIFDERPQAIGRHRSRFF
ncbi:MAG: hypothetical protein LR015_00485 [Verrucomicrobia bacterium]|nr:hypothetical protein [Verrucomicrobiota bacterium]